MFSVEGGKMLDRLFSGMLGRTFTQERAAADVDALVQGYESEESTKQLLEFGRTLLRANDERAAALDTKATTIVAYSAAILAFMVSRNLSLVGQPSWRVFLWLLAGTFATVACVSAGMALRAARNWQNMGEATWFPADRSVVDDPDKLGRWYLRAMHESLQQNHRITNEKASETICAQLAVAGAGVCLALSLVGAAITALWG
jgi:hypothetical protein